MENANPHGDPAGRLKHLLKAAAFESYPVHRAARAIACTGRTRDWSVVARLDRQWLHLYTYVCAVPSAATVRARLFEEAMRLCAPVRLAKFVCSDALYLELDYRAEHLDAAVLARLIGHLHDVAEEGYPRIFRIVSGDETLDALEVALTAKPAADA